MKRISKFLLFSVFLICWTRGEETVSGSRLVDTVNATIGQDISLTCVLPENENAVPIWTRMKDALTLSAGSYRVTPDRRVSARFVESERKYVLQIKDVRLSDDTTYECRVGSANMQTTAIKLNVQGPPAKIVEGAMLTIEAASPLKLTCVVPLGVQPVAIEWTKDEVNISNLKRNDGSIIVSQKNGSQVSTLIIDSAKPGDFGSYTCSPLNSASATVLVIEKFPVTEPPIVTEKVEVSRNLKISGLLDRIMEAVLEIKGLVHED